MCFIGECLSNTMATVKPYTKIITINEYLATLASSLDCHWHSASLNTADSVIKIVATLVIQ
jgi:hypothetical protein